MPSFAKALVAFGIACQLVDAAPSAFNFIQPRDELVQYDAFYQEIVHVVAMTSTVYVDTPQSSPTPAPQEEPAETPSPSPIEKKAVDTSAAQFSGEATYYTPGMGSCGWTNTESDCIVAISSARMSAAGGSNGNPMCGKMVDISCGGNSVSAKVVDTCQGCAHDDLDLSPSCFEKISPLDAGRAKISWSFQ